MKITDLKVLVCDDSILIRKKLTDMFTELGIKSLYQATDGEQAVEQYKANNPDLVIMDIVMPKKTGIQALQEIKAINPAAKVVMASTIGTQSNLTEAIKAGATDFLQKPVQLDDVLKVINSFIA